MRTALLALAAALLLSAAVAGEAIPNRIAAAKAGEWVLMEDVSGGDAPEQTRVTLLRIDGASFTVKREHFGEDGAVVETKEHEISLADYNRRMEEMASRAQEITREFITINEKEYPVTAVRILTEETDANGEPREFKVWLSPDLPIGGVAKTWSSDADFPSAEVIDFGF